jgi:hypothetical protein
MNIAKSVVVLMCALSAALLAQNQHSLSILPSSSGTSSKPAQKGSANVNVIREKKILERYGKLPLTFERNQGQSDPNVKFLSRGGGYTLFLTQDEALFAMRGGKIAKAPDTMGHEGKASRVLPISMTSGELRPNDDKNTSSDVLRMKLRGANRAAAVSGEDVLPGKSNYFIGNDPKKWHNNVPTYGKVKYAGVYPGIDLVYYGNQRQLEYDFIVAPGADPQRIQFDVTGARSVRRDGNGDLVLKLAEGAMRWHKPVAYQGDGDKRREIAANYVLKGKDVVAFEIATYDTKKPLFIDPLVYSTYLGGSDYDAAFGIAIDTAGEAYVAGYTASVDFPTANPLQQATGGSNDVFVTKLNAVGSALVYSTYLGGSLDDRGFGIAVDLVGNAYVTGVTNSTNYPTANALQPNIGGGQDAFLAKFNPSGSALIYSTYLGGSGSDTGTGIATDSLGNTFAVGYTTSTDFPTVNALQPTNAGMTDVFLAKLDPAGSSFFYSTYLGGSGVDSGAAIAIDSGGKAYVTGSTTSTNFPVKNAFQPTFGGNQDAFVSVIGTLDGTLVYSTYLGGLDFEEGTGIALDAAGDAYVTGGTSSANFPTVNAVQPNFGGGEDAYVAELDKFGSAMVFSTYLGGSSTDVAYGIALDILDNVFVVGTTLSTDFPILNPIKTKKSKGYDIFASQLSPGGLALVYSTYMGAAGDDIARGVAADSVGNAYLTGYTNSTNFSLVNPIQATYGGGTNDAFVSEIRSSQPHASLTPPMLNFGNQTLGTTSNAASISLRNSGALTLLITSIQVTGANAGDYAQTNDCPSSVAPQAGCTINVTFSPSTVGPKSAAITIADNASDSPESAPLTGNGALPAVTFTPNPLKFPTQLVFTTSQAQILSLTNSGLGTLFITNVSIAGPFTQTNDCGTSLPADSSCSFTVTFKPLNRGTLTGGITVTDNAPGSTQTASLTGTGTFIQLIPTSINFGTQPIHSTSLPHKIAVTNKGSVAVSIGSISIVGMNAGDFSQTNNCGAKLDFGATCMITVTFTPTVRGNRSANISITDNGGGSPQKTSLFGVGT